MATEFLDGPLPYDVFFEPIGRPTLFVIDLVAAASILLANAFGLMAGEWKGASVRTRRFLFAAVAFILVAVIVLNLGGLF